MKRRAQLLASKWLARVAQEHGFEVGDILISHSVWGGRTDVDFYQVKKATPKTVTAERIRSKLKGRGPTADLVPLPGRFSGPVIRKKIKYRAGLPYIQVDPDSRAYKWSG